MNKTVWPVQYIGNRWTKETDCYYWTRQILKEQIIFELPNVLDKSDKEKARAWIKAGKETCDRIAKPSFEDSAQCFRDFDILIFKQKNGQDGDVHIGVWTSLDGGGVLHCVDYQNLMFTDAVSMRVNGWEITRAYRPCL